MNILNPLQRTSQGRLWSYLQVRFFQRGSTLHYQPFHLHRPNSPFTAESCSVYPSCRRASSNSLYFCLHRNIRSMTGIASVHPSAPRPSASLIVVNARNEILFVHRNPQAQSFGGVHVFPGGNYDAAQDDSYQMTAIRETFEESGVLLASSRTQTTLLSDAVVDSSRRSIHAQQMLFKDFLKEHNLETDRKYLLPFTEWVTPPQVPRRFHTRFYVAFLPSSSTTTSDFSHGTIQHRLPTSDGGLEVIAARFIHPLDALAEFRSSKIALMPPQYYLITTLAGVLHGREATLEQQARVRELAAGAFGSMVINPRGHPGGQDQDGRSVLTYEGDETRGGSKGRLHRSLVRFGKKGIPTEIVLLRNFDVFTEIEHQAFSKQSRL